MALTLRGLLAYLDDRLTPEASFKVGEFIQEHDKLRQLTDRIKRVVRRRRLSTPDLAERQELPPHHTDDPNEVAAYLDGKMTADKEADFEVICMDTDVYLAEVAACHQIMTFGNETLKVPPLARQRMYSLVKGPESQPLKIVPKETRHSKPPLWEVSDGSPDREDEEQGPLEPLYHSLLANPQGKGILAVAAILLISLLGFVVWNIPWQTLGTENNLVEKQNVPPDNRVLDIPLVKEPVKQALQAQVLWPVPVITGESQPAWQPPVQFLAGVTSMVAARPTLPLNFLLGLGEELTTNDSIIPLPVLGNARPRVPAPERNAHVPIGTNGADTLGMFIQQTTLGQWKIIRPQGSLTSNELLVALPGYSGNILLQSGIRLLLLGQFASNLSANPFAEAIVELHPSTDNALDFTLHRGRLILQGSTAQQLPALVRLRFLGETWEIILPTGSEIGLQAGGQVIPGEGPWVVEQSLEIIGSKGNVQVKRLDQVAELTTKKRLAWNSSMVDDQPALLSEMAELPIWIAKHQTTSKEAVESLVNLRSRTHAKLQNDNRDLDWFQLACEEALEEGKLIDRQPAMLGLASINQLQPLIALMSDANANGRRRYSQVVIQQWLNQDVTRSQHLLDRLKEAGYSDEDAKLLLALFRGTTKSTPATLQALLQGMNHPRVAIREQAYQVLTTLVPDRPNIFDASGPVEQRTKAIEVISKRILPVKGNGTETLPP